MDAELPGVAECLDLLGLAGGVSGPCRLIFAGMVTSKSPRSSRISTHAERGIAPDPSTCSVSPIGHAVAAEALGRCTHQLPAAASSEDRMSLISSCRFIGSVGDGSNPK